MPASFLLNCSSLKNFAVDDDLVGFALYLPSHKSIIAVLPYSLALVLWKSFAEAPDF